MTAVEVWEERVRWPLAGAALLFLAAYATPIVFPGVPHDVHVLCDLLIAATWVLFAVDYFGRLYLSKDRWHFFRKNVLDLAVIALPVLRPLRLLRLVALIAILNRAGSASLRGRVVMFAIGGTVLLVTCGALAITDAERGKPGSTIANVGDGLWWAMSTITTVGYGDRYPVTPTGRFIAAALMVGGIALLGVVTATLASWLVERVAEVNEQEEAVTRTEIDSLLGEIRALRAEIGAMSHREDPEPVEQSSG
ncbi:potassium channel family protein [Cellulomonas sp. McL0617]|uniref:potassium channel family protein n=1 Tax=Cellulomonas sp. McL0617 TaxID=3415675 RepID=UPI003CF9D1EC